jgi:putative copper export protein
MVQSLLHGIITFIELVSLSTLFGVALCLLWTVRVTTDDKLVAPSAAALRRLLMLCLITLVVSSVGNLLQRTMEMSGRSIIDALPLIPTVLFKTHYGSVGFVRATGLGLALIVWFFGKRHLYSKWFGAIMLCAVSAIAFSRSATSHAADFGDLSLQELADWVHLLASAGWGGALLAIAVTFSPYDVANDNENHHAIAGIADRFYTFFGLVFAVLMATGLYNAWVEVGDFGPLWTTSYGRILSIKLVIVAILTMRYAVPPQHGKDDAGFAMLFLRRIRTEAILVLLILLCVAVFSHEIPGRHASHMLHTQGQTTGHSHDMGDHTQHGHGM